MMVRFLLPIGEKPLMKNRNSIIRNSSHKSRSSSLVVCLVHGVLVFNHHILRSERFYRLSREGFWVVVGQAMAVLGSLLGVRMLTGLMDPAAYGELALGLTLATLVNQTVLGPLGNGVSRFYAPAQENTDLDHYFSAVRQLMFSATGIIVLVTLLVAMGLLLAGRTEWIPIAIAALIFATLSGYNSVLNGIQNAARQRSVVALHQGMESWARFLVAAGLMFWLGGSSTVAMVGYAMAIILVLGSQYVFFRRAISPHTTSDGNSTGWTGQIWNYSWPMALTGIMSWAFFASQRWALQLFASTRDVGYFSAVFQVGYTPISTAGSILMALIMPIIFSRAGDGADKQRVNRVSRSIVKFCFGASLIFLVATWIAYILHDAVFRLLVAQQYWGVSRYLPFAVLAAGLFQVSQFLSTIILADAKTSRLLPLNTIGNSLIIVLTVLCTRLYGMDGLFFSMVGGSTIHLCWNIYNAHRVLTYG